MKMLLKLMVSRWEDLLSQQPESILYHFVDTSVVCDTLTSPLYWANRTTYTPDRPKALVPPLQNACSPVGLQRTMIFAAAYSTTSSIRQSLLLRRNSMVGWALFFKMK